ncbi:MAG TPA: tRNA (N6-isopentenyl adenosine(37)-C2)-methylthiotransferase MiaB [Anaerolineales bacterium]|nr:tRNA (N6-isopentenyl adenosine(37)-C2)-methylthiotransferase MiaB [Anaerolineales bacterium]
MNYHIWTEGCQMNVADSSRLGSELERLGYQLTPQIEAADIIVLNTCVVRQSAEDKAYGRLTSLRPLKEKNPDLVINLMGCMVGVRGFEKLQKKLPFVDVFSPPSDPGPLISFLTQDDTRLFENKTTQVRYTILDNEIILPEQDRGKLVSAYIPIVYGCSHACTFCIIPYRRGIERSRPMDVILSEARSLVRQGVRELTLLGQIVDRYGEDLADGLNLSVLLRELHKIDSLQRIRFLTSHPNYLSRDILETVAELSKVMPHIEVPIQAGNDQVLQNMKRGYTNSDYRSLVDSIREIIPGSSIATDIIVGFPGETHEQFMETFKLLDDLKLDVAHLARYSPRKGTVSERRMPDDIPEEEKMDRFRMLEDLQEGIAGRINESYLGQKVLVLFEDKVKGRWRGRTPTNKLVFVESEQDLRGREELVSITWTGPWSMQAKQHVMR